MGVVAEVVIVGAGFGGLECAKALAAAPVRVTLIDRNNFGTFQPLLYQVATAGLDAADVAHPVRGMFHGQENLRFRQGSVTGVDWNDRRVALADGDQVRFDHLVVAGGATVNFFGTPGAEEHALPLYTLADAGRLRNHVIGRFEAAERAPELLDDGALTFVVVGGGPTGVEVAGALAELFAMVLRHDYRDLDVGRARVVLVEAVDRLLPPFHPSSSRHARETLEARGIEVRLGTTVSAVDARSVTFSDSEVLPCQTLVWAAGVKPHPLAAAVGVELGPRGRIAVAPDLAIPGRPGGWAIGDIAATPGRDGPLPQVAPVAMQGGRHVARQIERRLTNRPTQAFRYRDKGTMATIGRRAAVAELPGGLRLRGTPAWLAWLGLHLRYLSGMRNRASVLLDWAWGYFTWDRGARLILRADPDDPSTG